MKALSIRQPWATLILRGGKDIENRVWRTKQRGTVLIHASKGMTRDEWEDAMAFARPLLLERHGDDAELWEAFAFDRQKRGGIVGAVDLIDCVYASPSRWYMGDAGFVLANPRPLPFFPLKGALGFFDVPDAVVDKLASSVPFSP